MPGPAHNKFESLIEFEGHKFRDLDHDGVVSPYEDWRLPVATRVADHLARLSLEEKIGLMLHGTAVGTSRTLGSIGYGREYDAEKMEASILGNSVTTFISRLALPPEQLATQNNQLQLIAARGRFGIPITLSSDPRHHFNAMVGTGIDANGFSQWPEALGLAATGDTELVRVFGDRVRRDYRAVGFHVSLAPQADLATSPRWPRFNGTFGNNTALVAAMTKAYVEGVQGGASGLTPTSVASVVKHWVGYGASRDGFDGHNYYGRFSAFPSGNFQAHVDAFLGAFESHVAGVMPTYNILDGLVINGERVEQVAGGFNQQILTGLLRGKYGFKGLIVSDWSISADANESCLTGTPPQTPNDIAMPWGVEHLPREERMAKGVNAGLDQFGGEMDPTPLLDAVNSGLVPISRIDDAAYRVLAQKFELGLFDNPFVDPAEAANVVLDSHAHDEARAAQRKSVVGLKSAQTPIVGSEDVVFVHNLDAAQLQAAGLNVTDNLDLATCAIFRLETPSEPLHPTFFFGSRMKEGRLDYDDAHPELVRLREISARVPTTVVVTIDRPPVLTNVFPHAHVLLAEFGISPQALVDVLTSTEPPQGKLPISLPTSMESVLGHPCDLPNTIEDALFPV